MQIVPDIKSTTISREVQNFPTRALSRHHNYVHYIIQYMQDCNWVGIKLTQGGSCYTLYPSPHHIITPFTDLVLRELVNCTSQVPDTR